MVHHSLGLQVRLFSFSLDLFYVSACMSTMCISGARGGQNWSYIDGCETPYECWELNPGPLQGQLEFLTTGLSPSPLCL